MIQCTNILRRRLVSARFIPSSIPGPGKKTVRWGRSGRPNNRRSRVADIQKQFEVFHESIKLKPFGENQILREKRDIIRGKLKDRLPEVFESHGEECPRFDFLDQGSYEMRTGTKPLNADYDIDQGLYLKVSTSAYPDPVVLKKRVHE